MIRIAVILVLLVGFAPLTQAQTYSTVAPSPLNNLTATVAPGATDDSSKGYSVGSIWQNTVTGTTYIAKSVALGAASWTALN